MHSIVRTPTRPFFTRTLHVVHVLHAVSRGALLAAAVAAAGCASLSVPAHVPATTGAAQSQASYHDVIDLAGRLSVSYQRNGHDEALHGNFTWNQAPRQTSVTLLSPLGQTLAVIDILPGRATMTQANQPPRHAADVDALAASALGWPLPIGGLRDWLQGVAIDAGGQRIVATPRTDTPIATHDGWLLRYVTWEHDANGGDRPKRIDLTRTTQAAGDVALRIVVDTWQPH